MPRVLLVLLPLLATLLAELRSLATADDRLKDLFKKIDADQDDWVTEPELIKWINSLDGRWIDEDVTRQWKEMDLGDSLTVDWDRFVNKRYGYVKEIRAKKMDDDNDDQFYVDLINKDKRRWQIADADGDGKLTRAEFTDFLHPEEALRMRDLVVSETMEDLDKNRDGFIDVDEYLSDMFHPKVPDDQLPDWVKQEKEQFQKVRDANGDGKLDKDEVAEWVSPKDYDTATAEAKHLMAEADKDQDGRLSVDEVIGAYDAFVGSAVTDFGEALADGHDEL